MQLTALPDLSCHRTEKIKTYAAACINLSCGYIMDVCMHFTQSSTGQFGFSHTFYVGWEEQRVFHGSIDYIELGLISLAFKYV